MGVLASRRSMYSVRPVIIDRKLVLDLPPYNTRLIIAPGSDDLVGGKTRANEVR